MEMSHVLSLLLGIIGIFVTVLVTMQKMRMNKEKQASDALWKRIDENRKLIDRVEHRLSKDYHDKKEIQDYVCLTQKPLVSMIHHIDGQIKEIKEMLQSLASRQG